MQDYFYALADAITKSLQGEEFYTCTFHAEDSDFVRFNRSTIRQAGTVDQRFLALDLIHGNRHAAAEIALSGDFDSDLARLGQLLRELREQLPHLPEDPHLLYATTVHSTVQQGENRLPDRADAVAAILDAGSDRDLVGIYAAGGIYAGFANALGQRNWFASFTFNCDWSLYYERDKAVKTSYAGFVWEPTVLTRKVTEAAEQLEMLRWPPHTISPGHYRVYLAPAALYDILEMLAWSGFGLKDHRTKQTTLLKMVEEGVRLHPAVTLRENTHDGVSPNFQAAGFIRPDQVTLIEAGAFHDCLVSPRSAKEYDVPTNGASNAEAPESVDMAAGDLARDDVLRQLDTGVYINNLWYLNYSDRSACRITGHDALCHVLGGRWCDPGPVECDALRRIDLSHAWRSSPGPDRRTRLHPDPSTYHERSTGSSHLPGALVEEFNFTL